MKSYTFTFKIVSFEFGFKQNWYNYLAATDHCQVNSFMKMVPQQLHLMSDRNGRNSLVHTNKHLTRSTAVANIADRTFRWFEIFE